ncbi:MAG TPA: sensor domain-containing protein, partial [Acidimicrobiales bacterium]|nr:sensor domain-containing protein [Acidimicrobiales bacterium]
MRLQLRLGSNERVIRVSEQRVEQVRGLARSVGNEPFTRRTWSELLYFAVSVMLAAFGVAFIAITMAAGLVLAVTFVGLVIIAASLRGARGIGGFHRALARGVLRERIDEPEPFVARAGFFGWLQSALRDRTGWRAVAYSLLKIPLAVFGVWFAFSVWVDAFFCLVYPLWGGGTVRPAEYGAVVNLFPPGFFSVGTSGFFHALFIFLTGVLLVFVGPWPMRLVVFLDRRLMRILLAPDALAARVRSLEDARARTVDASAATLRRIERDLHDGTQAQLVALAMRLGQAKEKLAAGEDVDLSGVRQLVDEAHRGAKEAIVELRDLARGIHPPALDVGLEGALSTLAARSPVPSDVTVAVADRPTPAIEAIAYFCVAELLANVAQHAHASRAGISCAQHGAWLRVVVRDDGLGGAQPAEVGSSSSGLAGLGERVRAVDGELHVTSP